MENLLSENPKPTGQVLESVRYGKIAGQPSRITQSEGFQTAISETGLREALIAQGINPQRIAEKVNVLLNAVDKEGNDEYTAIDKGLKHATAIYGILPDEKPKGPTTYNFIFNTDVQRKVKHMEAEIKELLTQHVPENQEDVEAQPEESRSTGEADRGADQQPS